MALTDHFDEFLSAMHKDSRLKNRIILWTFLALVFPTALLVAAGVPEKPAYITMAALVLPLQIVVYSLTSDRGTQKAQKTSIATPHLFLGRATTHDSARRNLGLGDGTKIERAVVTHPDTDHATWNDILANLKTQEQSSILVGDRDQALYNLKMQSADTRASTLVHFLAPESLLVDRLVESVLRQQLEKEWLKRAEEQRKQGGMSDALSTTAVPAI